MTDPKKILDLLQKLVAHAESATKIGNEEEAKTFAAKIQELLGKYKLSMADVKGTAHVGEEINTTIVTWRSIGLPERSIPIWWPEILGRVVANAYYTIFVAVRGNGMKLKTTTHGQIGYFVGAETDRKFVVWMFAYLARFIETEARREHDRLYRQYKKAGFDTGELRNFQKGWIEGFLVRLIERFEEEFEEDKPETTEAPSGSQAIVLRTGAFALCEQWLKLHQPNVSQANDNQKHELPDGSTEGFEAGLKAADSIDLKKKVIEEHAGGPQRLADPRTVPKPFADTEESEI